MRILLVSATEAELAPFAAMLEKFNPVAPYSVELCVTGVGIPATTVHLTKHVLHKTYDLILNIGVAGAIDNRIDIPSLVWVKQDEFYDWGAEDQTEFLSVFDLGLIHQNDFPFSTGVLLAGELPSFTKGSNIGTVDGITVMRVHGNEQSIAMLIERCKHAQVESMEGAAVFYTAAHFHIPCIQLRAISNRVEPRNRAAWKMHEAIELLNNQLVQWFVTP
jgi:futalosine hydrolase